MPDLAALQAYVQGVLGPVRHSTVLTRRVGRVVAVEDRSGRCWVVKTAGSRGEFTREHLAYTQWVPAFADQAPRLLHADAELRTLIIEWVPGVGDWTFEPADHHDAGRLLRRLHQAAPPRHDGPSVGDLAELRLEVATRRAVGPGALATAALDHAAAGVGDLRRHFDHLPRVPTHGDFGGHNWLRGPDRLRVIDFATARYDSPVTDFARLYLGPWWERPDLAAAFFEGYGRTPTEEELACVRLQLPTLAVGLVTHGARHGDVEMQRRGRYRLDKLVAGHDFTRYPSGLRGTYHALRRRGAPTRRRPAGP
jgi:hypothetical protein